MSELQTATIGLLAPANIAFSSAFPCVLWTGSHELGHKHLLHDNFERQIALCGGDASSVAHFWPRCWQLSSQPQREAAMAALTQAYVEWSRNSCGGADAGVTRKGQRQSEEPLWILKPINQSRGLGIRLISQWEEISPDEMSGYLVQRYLQPYLPPLLSSLNCQLTHHPVKVVCHAAHESCEIQHLCRADTLTARC